MNKGKDHNSQTQQYFIKFLKYISYKYGLHVSTSIESSSGAQGVDPDIQTFTVLRWGSHNAVNICMSGSTP